MPVQPARGRPFGVKVITVLLAVSILVPLLLLIAFWYSPQLQVYLRARFGLVPDAFLPTYALGMTGLQPAPQFDLSMNALLPVVSLLAIIGLQVVILTGFIRLMRWAWYMVILLAGVSMVANLWRYFTGVPEYLSMVINVLTVLYLNQREVQQAFQQSPNQKVR